MTNDIDTAEFFNRLSLSNFEDMAGKNNEDISFRLRLLEERFGNDIQELTELSVGNKTRTKLLHSVNTVEYILKGIVDESSFKTLHSLFQIIKRLQARLFELGRFQNV